MADKDGWGYVLTNEAMPGLVKVGQTYKTPEIRAQELSSETGVAAQYVVVYKAFVPNYEQVEKIVHDKLKSAGKHYNKEFFKCEIFEAIRHIRDSTSIKFEESKEDIDKRIQQQKELEEQRRIQQTKKLQQAEKDRIKEEELEKWRKWEDSFIGRFIDFGFDSNCFVWFLFASCWFVCVCRHHHLFFRR